MTSSEVLTDIPELFETVLGESLVTRTEALPTFRLGPPDLIHILKSSTKPNQKDVTTYHYVLGLETSSPGSLAAYINTLTYALPSSANSWFASKPHYRIKSGMYCCFNAISKVDVRVDVRIPGGVECYAVNRLGKRLDQEELGPLFWSELFVSSCVRAILHGNHPISPPGMRIFDPLPHLDNEKRFLAACIDIFPFSAQLGPEPNTQMASTVSNLMTHALHTYFGQGCGRWNVLATFWEQVLSREPDAAAPLAAAYIGMDQEVRAVKLMYEALAGNSLSVPILAEQTDYLRSKKRSDYALIIARRLVIGAPLEFHSWARLTKCYVDLKDWKLALLTLNSCPMFVSPGRDVHNMPQPSRVHFPLMENDIIADLAEAEQSSSAPISRADQLRGTARLAYELLTEIVNHSGWEELLKHRAQVFVMEDEYRRVREKPEDRAEGEESNPSADVSSSKERPESAPKVNGEMGEEEMKPEIASPTDSKQPQESPTCPSPCSKMDGKDIDPSKSVAETNDTISNEKGSSSKADTESQASDSDEKREDFQDVDLAAGSDPASPGSKATDEDENDISEGVGQLALKGSQKDEEKKPEDESKVMKWVRDAAAEGKALPLATTPAEDGNSPIAESNRDVETTSAADDDSGTSSRNNSILPDSRLISAFSHKRLCERWLDDLFLILYEDLRVYTAWKAEENHARVHSMAYKRSHSEWEYLGDLARRLGRKQDAKEAYSRAIEQKSTVRVSLRLLDLISDDSEEPPERTIDAITQLITIPGGASSLNLLYKIYGDVVYPSPLANALMRLMRHHGLQRVQAVVLNMNLPGDQFRTITRYLDYAETFRVAGSDW